MIQATARDAAVASYPVLIVGAGPVGLTMSISLGRLGVDSLLVERRKGPSPYPRSTAVSVRTMQIYRQWGIAEKIEAGRIPARPYIFLVPTLGADPSMLATCGIPEPEASAPYSPVAATLAPLDHVEPVLLNLASTLPASEVRYENELIDFTDTGDHIDATILDRHTGEVRSIRAQYLVAADGAHSPVRERLGIRLHGYGHVEEYRSYLFETPELGPLVDHRPAAIFQVTSGPYPGKFMRHGQHRWTFGLPMTKEIIARGDLPDTVTLIRAATGMPELTLTVLKEMTYELVSAAADRLRSGRVFLAGDAVHQQTPIGGTGNNTGTHDAVNLAWKLAAVLQGWAGPRLLDSYEQERQPVADRNVSRSVNVARFFDFEDLCIDLGYRYCSSAIACERHGESMDSYTTYVPSGEPGRQAPHAWIRVDGSLISTIDLADRTFVLLTSNAGWAAAADAAAAAIGVPLRTVIVPPDEASTWWHHRYGITLSGAALIRPDGVIAWRSPGFPNPDAAADLLIHSLRYILDLGEDEPPRFERPAAFSSQTASTSLDSLAMASA